MSRKLHHHAAWSTTLAILAMSAGALSGDCPPGDFFGPRAQRLFTKIEYFKANSGTLVQDAARIPFRLPEGAQAHFIAEGFGGGRVYRVVLGDGTQEAWKYYDDIATAAEDYMKLKLLYRVSKQAGYRGLAVAEPLTREGLLVRMKYHPGQSIDRLAKLEVGNPSSPNFTLTAKQLIDEIYLDQVRLTLDAVQAEIPSLERGMASPGVASWIDEDGRHSFYLHRDNVIVDPHDLYQMTIIDPR